MADWRRADLKVTGGRQLSKTAVRSGSHGLEFSVGSRVSALLRVTSSAEPLSSLDHQPSPSTSLQEDFTITPLLRRVPNAFAALPRTPFSFLPTLSRAMATEKVDLQDKVKVGPLVLENVSTE